MELRLKREPHIKLSGGRVLRLLARVLISGGVRGLLQRMLRNLTYADNGKGFTWKGEMLQNPTYTSVEFLMKAPIVPSRVLSSTMRLLNRFSRRRSRMRSRPPVKFDKAKRKPRVRSGKRRKVRISYRRYRRKRKGSLWMRIFVALYRDLKAAEQIIP